jgi:hypothetical protein
MIVCIDRLVATEDYAKDEAVKHSGELANKRRAIESLDDALRIQDSLIAELQERLQNMCPVHERDEWKALAGSWAAKATGLNRKYLRERKNNNKKGSSRTVIVDHAVPLPVWAL